MASGILFSVCSLFILDPKTFRDGALRLWMGHQATASSGWLLAAGQNHQFLKFYSLVSQCHAVSHFILGQVPSWLANQSTATWSRTKNMEGDACDCIQGRGTARQISMGSLIRQICSGNSQWQFVTIKFSACQCLCFYWPTSWADPLVPLPGRLVAHFVDSRWNGTPQLSQRNRHRQSQNASTKPRVRIDWCFCFPLPSWFFHGSLAISTFLQQPWCAHILGKTVAKLVKWWQVCWDEKFAAFLLTVSPANGVFLLVLVRLGRLFFLHPELHDASMPHKETWRQWFWHTCNRARIQMWSLVEHIRYSQLCIHIANKICIFLIVHVCRYIYT